MIQIGEYTISRVEEVILDEATSLFPELGEETLAANRGWLSPNFYNEERGVFLTMVHSWILRSASHTIIIDTAGGDDKDRPLSPRFHRARTGFLERLKAAGIDPEAVDMVILTHLHSDHVGWNTRLAGERWVPTFPNAEHIASRAEVEARDPERGAASRPPASWNVYRDSIQPIIDAGLLRLVEGNEALLPGVSLFPVPGHAPGMMGVRVEADGKVAMFISDVMHQPLQVSYPDWNSRYCEDQDLARLTRAKILDQAAREGALLLPAHFGQPYAGYVRRDGDRYRFEPVETML
ncbi:Glyoxylase, beta-lactamase superfamily II [Faunimonas pinastri]|uniref:Glyoxylase, beta-lactamase superfamily II n=1 Tax=Faunimonas pinastri TaxID=1855383 RepID=A0A1H9EC44_9HYPH|nr:MBL fold metallo-hydrolase [Faunimonas pinastri]SEQ23271.1 Glyoxylase, beta-lactamase superfamily II [Faunimonas pinastri]